MQTGTSMNSGINRATSAASKGAGEIAANVSEHASEFGSAMTRVKDQIINAVSEEAQVATDLTKKAVKQIPALMDSLEGTIRKHPFTAAAIAVGIGAIVVNFLTRERRVRQH